MNHDNLIVPPGKKIALKDYDPAYTGDFTSKNEAKEKLEKDIERLAKLQEVLYAHDRYALLLIFQAMDAAGKDGVIKHVMSGVNPQGCQVFSFKAPSQEELDHDFMWRTTKALPERGRIGIFNRSYYEEVLIVRVHPEILNNQNIPDEERNEDIWQHRFEDINNFERYLTRSGTVILKFFLNVSRKEQKERFLERIERPEKNWKFSFGDVKERARWDDYMHAYEEMLNHTSTKWAPWHVIPADRKWFTRAAVADIIASKLESLDMEFPEVSEAHQAELQNAKEMLESE
ncbi:MAG: polyphosphate kinase 2 family protein [Bacteroidetes bacterium]|nr:polyphosphate kinase 2 family protein [Bacteroidota bacterium]MCW5894748.1 polyphosphate kinase 2 family protein [Bacteroidota bacterium]